ncbi:MAG: DUF5005 domain-containing protein [Prevotella sp.]|nr:DUF5005 domain-containing protein [Prevotella sp.]
MKTYAKKSRWWLMLSVVALASVVVASCYTFTLIEMPHEVIAGSTFNGKVVVKRNGKQDNGLVQHIYGLYGICLPDGWEATGDMVMTQVPKETTDVGDPEYKETITRQMLPNERYTKLLNDKYYKPGYKWHGFATDRDFKSLFNTKEQVNEVDSIYVEYSIKTSTRTGTFYLDFIAGQTNHDKLDVLGDESDNWNTQTATFTGDGIGEVFTADTHITVTNEDGSINEEDEDVHVEAAWKLEFMPESTQTGSKVKAYKDKLYDALFTRSLGWNGGDGVFTVALPDGNVFWTFNDSFYGKVNANRNRPGGNNFPRNSIMVQLSDNGFPTQRPRYFAWLADYVNWTDSSKDRYYNCRTHLRHPLGEKTAEEIARGDIDQIYLYWSGDGRIYNGKLQMLWFGVDNHDNQMKNIGTALATYNLDGEMPSRYYTVTSKDYLPHEGDYLYLESVNHNLNNNPVSYGSTLYEGEDGHNYLYANNSYRTVVARTATEDLSSKWEYYVCDNRDTWEWHWQDEYPTTAQLEKSDIVRTGGGLNLPWVIKEGDWYYLISQGAYFSKTVYLFRGKTPYGPFDERRELFHIPAKLDKIGRQDYGWLYMVNIHQELSRTGELVFTTNTDPPRDEGVDSFSYNFNDDGSADFYRPYFYRVFNWKYLYSDYEEPTGITSVRANSKRSDHSVYDLNGRRVLSAKGDTSTLAKGIYIRDGKKFVVK